ncbi:MAG: nuclear transport factor 2 family protein [Candidatus Binatia bacterium]
MGETRDRLLAELLDREAIRNLAIRYADRVWQNDVDGVVALFTNDGEFIFSGSTELLQVKGRENLTVFFERGFERLGRPLPFVHNHLVEMTDADHATGTASLEVRSGQRELQLVAVGSYRDEYEKVGGEWKFKRRTATLFRFDDSAAPRA